VNRVLVKSVCAVSAIWLTHDNAVLCMREYLTGAIVCTVQLRTFRAFRMMANNSHSALITPA
jgi:hypothetical protein